MGRHAGNVVVLGAVVVLAGWMVGASVIGSTASEPRSTTHRGAYATVDVPAGWHAELFGPRVLTAWIGSREDFSADARRCTGRVAVFVNRFDSRPPDLSSYPSRHLIDASSGGGFQKAAEFPCGAIQGLGFRDNGRFYTVSVYRGRHASETDLEAAYRMINSMAPR